MLEHLDFIRTITEAGAVGLATLALIILWRVIHLGSQMASMVSKIAENHLAHIYQCLGGLKEATDGTNKRLDGTNERLDKLVDVLTQYHPPKEKE